MKAKAVQARGWRLGTRAIAVYLLWPWLVWFKRDGIPGIPVLVFFFFKEGR